MGNVPLELTSFVGRGRELSDIKRLLAVARLITLTGPGGIGKSRLAVRAAHKLGRHFRDGVWLVELAELDGPDLVPYALARSLGVHERLDAGMDDALIGHLRERRLLIVLDNCEHLLDACRQFVLSVLTVCGQVRVLCTSRERLGVPGEAIVALSGLELPAVANVPPVAGRADVDALRLLVDRAVAGAPDFALTDDNRDAAGDICRRLDGLPLALELAAVRLASMSADDLRERLDDRLALLGDGDGSGSERSRTLGATIDWSHELLAEEERILWRRLSVFAGSFGLEAAEDVCSGAGLQRERIVDLVGGLVRKSILTMGQGGRRGRYRFPEMLRLYGAQRLAEASEDAELARRHAVWYAERFSGGDRPWWATREQGESLEALDVEWANVEAALDFFTASARDAEIGLGMAADLWLYWLVRGHYRAGAGRLDALLAIEPAPTPTRAMALWGLAFLSQSTGDYARALSALEEARTICDRTGGDRELAYVLDGLRVVHLRLGDFALAADLGGRSRELMQRRDDDFGLSGCLFGLASAAAAAGDLPGARRLVTEALQASDRAGDKMVRGISNGLLGTVEWLLGNSATAEARLKEAVGIQDLIGHRWGMLTSLEGLAWVAGSSGRLERAALLLGAGAALSEELGIILFPHGQAQHDACEQAVRAGLGEAGYRGCWERGFALGREQVVAAALEDAPAAVPQAAEADDAGDLSARELEVARLVGDGLSNRAIAADLFVSVATVKTHVSHILSKLGLESRVQIASWLADRGLRLPAP